MAESVMFCIMFVGTEEIVVIKVVPKYGKTLGLFVKLNYFIFLTFSV